MVGMTVKMLMAFPGYPLHDQVLNNVTEIHYNYERVPGSGHYTNRIAFESDIHGTGVTYDREEIYEFEVTPAKEIASSF